MADQAWAPVAGQAVGTFERVPPMVQIVTLLAGTVIVLAIIGAWYLSRRRSDGDGTVPAALMVQVTTEFSHQVATLSAAVEGMADIVEGLRDAIKGCSTCSFNPNVKKD